MQTERQTNKQTDRQIERLRDEDIHTVPTVFSSAVFVYLILSGC